MISSAIFANGAAALSAASVSGGHTFINAGNGDVIVLMNYTSLNAGDFFIF